MEEKKQSPILEMIYIVAVSVAWVILETLAILQVDTQILANSEYVAGSMITEGSGIAHTDLSVGILFMYVLRAIFYVVGNHAVAVLWLQFALHFIGSFLIYRGVRRLFGRVFAVILYAVMLFVPFIFIPVEEVQPLWFVFAVAAFVVYLVSLVVSACKRKGKDPNVKNEKTPKEKTSNEKAPKEPQSKEETTNKKQSGSTEEGQDTKQDCIPKVKLLDNPLPGPKKHVSKVLDYDLNLERMPRVFQRYDIKVADDDDFDIK